MLVSPTSAIQHLDKDVPDELADLVVRKSADSSNTDLSTTSDDYPESLDSSTGEEISHLKQVGMDMSMNTECVVSVCIASVIISVTV